MQGERRQREGDGIPALGRAVDCFAHDERSVLQPMGGLLHAARLRISGYGCLGQADVQS
jgi:hypothetical protein